MSTIDSSSPWGDSSSDEKFNMNEEEKNMLILTMHAKKRVKHGGSVFGCEVIPRIRQDGHNRLMLNYFAPNLVYLE